MENNTNRVKVIWQNYAIYTQVPTVFPFLKTIL